MKSQSKNLYFKGVLVSKNSICFVIRHRDGSQLPQLIWTHLVFRTHIFWEATDFIFFQRLNIKFSTYVGIFCQNLSFYSVPWNPGES